MQKRNVIVLAIGVLVLVIAAVPVLAKGVHPAYHQGFEQDSKGWITDDTPGILGWCGDITRYERGSGPVAPAKGRGYAVVEDGACNAYWTARGWVTSGPYSSFGGYSDSWPPGGYVTELDIYLDPAWSDGTGFQYYVSIYLLNIPPPANNARYFLIPVSKTGGNLLVAGYPVTTAGWYTFRLSFQEDEGGQLAVDFDLAQNGQVLFNQVLLTTVFTGEATSSFDVSNVGTGYSWFHAITSGLQLPIDEHSYRPGH